MSKLAMLILVGWALTAPGVAVPVTNPGFETGDFTGWTPFGDSTFTGVDAESAHTGDFGAFFGPSGVGGVQQTLTTVAGNLYQISFFLQQEGGSLNSFGTDFGGIAGPALTNSAPFGYTQFSYNAIASSASTALRFSFTNQLDLWDLDDVVVTDLGAAGAPELNPGVAAVPLAVVGLTGLLLSDGRRRRAVS